MASMHEFLDALLADPAKLEKFEKKEASAQEVMDAEGLSTADQDLLKTGNNQQIRDRLKDELKNKANAYVIRMA